MIAYITLGTNDLERSIDFYDDLLAEIGGRRTIEIPRLVLWRGRVGTPLFGIVEPVDGNVATCGNGTMVSLRAKNSEMVSRMYHKALKLGATDAGAPGPRQNGSMKFYAGYFRDLDGNKLSFFCL